MKDCKVETIKDYEGDWIAKCISHKKHKYLSGISRYEKCAVKILKDAVEMCKEMKLETR